MSNGTVPKKPHTLRWPTYLLKTIRHETHRSITFLRETHTPNQNKNNRTKHTKLEMTILIGISVETKKMEFETGSLFFL